MASDSAARAVADASPERGGDFAAGDFAAAIESVGSAPGDRALGRRRVRRFSLTERALHWINATAMLLLIATGLVLYLPFLASTFSDRPLIKGIHLFVAVLWFTGLVLVSVLGDRRVLSRARRDFESMDRADLAWLRHQDRPAGRYNGGQKLHAVVQAALVPLFFLSGSIIWLAEHNTAFRLPGTIALHDVSMFVAIIFIIGHLYKSFAPDTRPALSGMVDGTVPESYAKSHHEQWRPADDPAEQLPPLTIWRLGAASLLGAAGVVAAIVVSGF
jgi:formate dehydrogenase subunit gamma